MMKGTQPSPFKRRAAATAYLPRTTTSCFSVGVGDSNGSGDTFREVAQAKGSALPCQPVKAWSRTGILCTPTPPVTALPASQPKTHPNAPNPFRPRSRRRSALPHRHIGDYGRRRFRGRLHGLRPDRSNGIIQWGKENELLSGQRVTGSCSADLNPVQPPNQRPHRQYSSSNHGRGDTHLSLVSCQGRLLLQLPPKSQPSPSP